jgi:hypothetical protein
MNKITTCAKTGHKYDKVKIIQITIAAHQKLTILVKLKVENLYSDPGPEVLHNLKLQSTSMSERYHSAPMQVAHQSLFTATSRTRPAATGYLSLYFSADHTRPSPRNPQLLLMWVEG